jgi:hypothetical protein
MFWYISVGLFHVYELLMPVIFRSTVLSVKLRILSFYECFNFSAGPFFLTYGFEKAPVCVYLWFLQQIFKSKT